MAKFSRYERHLLRTYAHKYHIPAHILAGQIEVESGNQPGQVSSAGAFGRTQFIPSTARSYGVKRGDTRSAVKSQYRGQAKYLADLGGGKDRAHLIAALGGYYGQQGTDYPSKVLGAAAKYYKHLGGGKGGGGRKGRTVGGNLQGKLKTTPGRSFAPERQQARLSTLSQAHGGMPSQNQLLSLASTLGDLQDTPPSQSLKLSRTKVRHVGGGGGGAIPRGGSPKGLANFEGAKVAAWIKPYLVYARKHGWKGKVSSGYRSRAEQTRIYNSGVRPAAKPGTSNHEGTSFPRGAVDVTDPQTLSRILRRRGTKKLQWAGAKDPVHFSHPHGGSY